MAAISVNRGIEHDVRFLAVIDTLADPEHAVAEHRLAYWKNWEISRHPDPANLWIARIGGLYAGYLALHESEAYTLRVQPRLDVEMIGGLLLARAGIQPVPDVLEQNLAIA